MESVGEAETWVSTSDRKEMDAVFQLCRRDDWKGVLACIERDPWISTTPMVMDNNITTTCLHQAITSKADIQDRAAVIRRILQLTPQAARIKNGYGSLPLHVIAQRNTKMKSETKEELIVALVQAYPDALIEEGGVGKRTPLHIIFTDYVSARLTQLMVDQGTQACFMKDKKGYLPAHVAASRHCSPEKLRMLLAVNPGSLRETTADGETLMTLATSTATKSHPNYALIDELHRQHAIMSTASRNHPASNEPPVTAATAASTEDRAAQFSHHPDYRHHNPLMTTAVSGSEPSLSSGDDSPLSRERLNSNDSNKTLAGWPSPPRSPRHQHDEQEGRGQPGPGALPSATRKKRKSRAHSAMPHDHGRTPVAGHPAMLRRSFGPPIPSVDDPVGLLLHFSQTATTTPAKESAPKARSPLHSRSGHVSWGNGGGGGGDHHRHYEYDNWYRNENHDAGVDEDGNSLPVNFAQV